MVRAQQKPQRSILSCLIIYLACAANCLGQAIQIDSGKITGVPASDSSSVTVYKGIPFAAPPVGNLRWKAPQPVEPWDGVKVMDSFGKNCIQPGRQNRQRDNMSEDCLYLKQNLDALDRVYEKIGKYR